MKNFLMITAAVLTFGLVYNSHAQYTGPGLSSITVEEAKKLSDDTPVVLTGKIEKNLGDEKYIFTDETGSVIIEIDNDDWKGITAGPDDLIEIHGEVDKNFTTFKIEVDKVVKR